MTSGEPLSTFYARPDQTLDNHLGGVARVSQSLVENAGETPYGDDWDAVMQTLAWTHDIGKLTEYFQTYVTTENRMAAESTELTHHGVFGGLVSAVVLARRGFSPETTAAGFYAVAKHHSVLQNVQADLGSYYQYKSAVDGRYDVAEQQFANIDETAAAAADIILQQATDGEYRWNDLTKDGLATARKTIANLKSAVSNPEFYGCVLRAWSTLVTADKFDASNLTSVNDLDSLTDISRPVATNLTQEIRSLSETQLPDGTQATSYLESPWKALPSSEATVDQRLAAIQTAANGRATRTLLDRYNDGDRVFKLTLPTGFGKTYTGLRATLKLAKQQNSRVIYALPYTSIIDQVDEQIQEVFGVSPMDAAYTKHHHLADTRTVPNEDDDFTDTASSGQETLHAESWRSGLVLTTFTQLFESAAGPRNVQSTKLPALQDSIILVDEPQAISLDWWALIGRLTSHLASEYNATLIFMTATQPRILERLPEAPDPAPLVNLQSECTELIGDVPRVEFNLHESLVAHLNGDRPDPLSITDAAAEIDGELTAETNSLAVVNTVGCAVALTEALSSESRISLAAELLPYLREIGSKAFDPDEYLVRLAQAHPEADSIVATLTTRLRPRDRSALLSALNRILDPGVSTPFDAVPTITVSTQLIEAGVDLSFDSLYRDYAPLPAIVQAAGRCNRQFKGAVASVTVWRLDSPPEKNYIPSQLIYGERSLLRPTQTALCNLQADLDSTILTEASMITRGVEWYYENLHQQRKTGKRADDLVDAFDSAKGRELRNASLVSSDYSTRDFIVLVSDSEVKCYDTYKRQQEAAEWGDARETFQQLKETVVSVPVNEPPLDQSLKALRVSDIADSYTVTSGQGVRRKEVSEDSEV